MAAKKQLEIRGTERKHIKEIKQAAEEYVEVRDQRMELTRKEVELRDTLMARMKKHGLTTHVEGDFEISIVSVDEKLRVKRLEVEGGGDLV